MKGQLPPNVAAGPELSCSFGLGRLPSEEVRLTIMGDQDNTFGKYRLIAELGHGGMADVYLAVVQGPAGFSKLQVIKQLRPHLADEPDFVRMFLDEARLAARLNHPNVVQTNEVGQEGRRHYLSMEYLDGQSFHRLIHRSSKQRPMPLSMHLRVIADVLTGLHHAHELTDFDGTPLSVVHRDVSPHNVFVTYEGQVKVVDFGIAKAATGSSETKTGVLKGKLTYMAPEQARSGRVDRRADLFSVGVMLWEAVTGRRMWSDATEVQILHMLTTGEIPPARQFVPNLAQALEAILHRALAYSPRDRYETALDFHSDLERYMTLTGERASNRELGEFTSDLFSDKRVEIKALIERQLRGLPSSATQPNLSSTLPQLDALNATGSSTHSQLVPSQMTGYGQQGGAPPTRLDIPASLAQVEVSGFPTVPAGMSRADLDPYALTNSPVTSTGIPAAPQGRGASTIPMVLGGVVVALAAIAALVYVSTTTKPADPATAANPPTGATSAVVAPPSSAVAVDAAQVGANVAQIQIKTTPEDAKVYIDDVLLPGTPPTGKFPKDGASHKLRVEAPGYVTKSEYVTCDADRTVEVALDRLVRGGPVPPAKTHKDPDPPPADTADKPPPSTTKRGKSARPLDDDDPWAHPK
jgi:eukaryotic-like serine/threonine-protein kinase